LNFDLRHFVSFAGLIARCNLEFKGRLRFLGKIHALRHRDHFVGVKVTGSESAIIESFTP
jgi:hypothetical protein